jgi:hypothetical protein
MGFPAKNRTMTIQAIDIHEFKDGKIVRTWHTEDWMTGLHRLGSSRSNRCQVHEIAVTTRRPANEIREIIWIYKPEKWRESFNRKRRLTAQE